MFSNTSIRSRILTECIKIKLSSGLSAFKEKVSKLRKEKDQ